MIKYSLIMYSDFCYLAFTTKLMKYQNDLWSLSDLLKNRFKVNSIKSLSLFLEICINTLD